MNPFGRLFGITLFSILALYLASFASFLFPVLNSLLFFTIALLTLLLTLRKFEYGLLLMLAEIFVGSKGYLFFFEYDDVRISLRMALFAIVVGVWTLQQMAYSKWRIVATFQNFFSRPYAICHMPYALLAIAITWGVFNGWLRGNTWGNMYHDANAWAYFLLVPIFYSLSLKGRGQGEGDFLRKLVQVFLGAVSAMVVKSFVLLYLFSHEFTSLLEYVYPWLRKFLLGEITVPDGGWPRIFFQSQIFVLIGFFVMLVLVLMRNWKNPSPLPSPARGEGGSSPRLSLYGRGMPDFGRAGEGAFLLLFLAAGSFATIIMSFSRSFWVGLLVGIIVLALLFIFQKKYFSLEGPNCSAEQFGPSLMRVGVATLLVSFLLLGITLYFPIPKPLGIDFPSAFKDRLTDLSEAAVRSRWDLVQPLWSAVAKHPLLGSGFGTTVTYHSSDPRAVELSVNGMFTTFTFEWGYFDLWLKLGLFGLAAYLFLLWKILRTAWRLISVPTGHHPKGDNDQNFSLSTIYYLLSTALPLGLLVLMAVHFFSPYLNHPLGIVYVVLVYTMVAAKETKVVASP